MFLEGSSMEVPILLHMRFGTGKGRLHCTLPDTFRGVRKRLMLYAHPGGDFAPGTLTSVVGCLVMKPLSFGAV